jgi:hypothetical protein
MRRRLLMLGRKAAHPARPRTRTEIMLKLSTSQAVLLAAAAARGDLSLLPPPETIRLKGAALDQPGGKLGGCSRRSCGPRARPSLT